MNELDDNRYVTEKLGICWHELASHEIIENGRVVRQAECSCGKRFLFESTFLEHAKVENPDFRTDPARLLREMEKSNDWESLARSICFTKKYPATGKEEYYIPTVYITTPGLFLAEVAKRFRGKEKP